LELDPIFPTWTKVEKQRRGSKPVWDQSDPFQNEKNQHDIKKVWNLAPIFPTWSKVEKQMPGYKHIWDPLGRFQNEKQHNDLERVWNLTPIFQHGQKWKSREQVPNPFGTSRTPFEMNRVNMILQRFGTWPLFPNMNQNGEAEARFQTHLAPAWPLSKWKRPNIMLKGFGT